MYSSFTRTAARTVARRSLSTPAAEHKPLLDLHGLAARYANATYTAASKAGTQEKVEGELLALQATASSNAEFKDFLVNPLIGRDAKVAQVETWLAKKTTATTLNLMTTLAGNARLSELDKIVSTYCQLMKAKRGQVEATITSAEPLTKAQTDAITKAMNVEGKKITLTTQVDPSMIGGLKVQVGDQFLDLSVASKIDKLSRTPV